MLLQEQYEIAEFTDPIANSENWQLSILGEESHQRFQCFRA